jgi:hypothetical protein
MFTIWTNAQLDDAPRAVLLEGIQPHRLIFSKQLSASNLAKAAPDPALQEADIAFGQPWNARVCAGSISPPPAIPATTARNSAPRTAGAVPC